MATVTVYTAARMKAIEDANVIGGTVDNNGHLILTKHDGSTIDAGDVKRLLPGRLLPTNNLGSGNNPDTLTDTGWYSGYSWVGPAGIIGGSIGTLEVIQYNPDWIIQTYTTIEQVPRKYVRSRFNGTTWGSWIQVTTQSVLDAAMALLVPPGSIIVNAGTNLVSGYLLCEGAAVSRITYGNLYSAIGTRYGAGDGTTTFNLPNLKGRVMINVDTSQTEFNGVGNVGGEKAHTLIASEIPPHQHGFMNDAHAILWGQNPPNNVTFPPANAQASATAGNNLMTSQNFWNRTKVDGGDGGAHNNLQPYITLYHFIKY